MKKLHLVSLGCNKNLVDSEVMLGKLKHYELCDDPAKADVLIVNTCGFIGPAKQESLNTIFSLHETRKKNSLLVMAGCLSERYKEELTHELKEVDLFTGVGDYDKIDEIIALRQNRFSPSTYLLNEEERVITGSNAHAYVKLSEGCNQTCSFCAIPNFKGKLFSRTLESIEKEVRFLVAKGFFDFSFISQDSSSFLRDRGEKEGLMRLIETIEAIEGVKSARILYLYPTTTSNALIERIIASPLFHNYFDMPIQHISDAMLKRMKRGAGKERIIEQLTLMRQAPNSFIRTSFIVGHPQESDAEFEELLAFMKTFRFDRVNIFAYSDEEDTSAHTMEGKIDTKTINARIKKLDKLVAAQTMQSLKNEIGKSVTILIEGESSEHALFMGARELLWAPSIDGEILVNDSDVENVRIGACYQAHINELAGDKLIAAITALA